LIKVEKAYLLDSGATSRSAVLEKAGPIEIHASDQNRSGVLGRELLASLLPWREQRFARCVSRKLLKLYQTVSGNHARLRGRDLYREIVIAHKRADRDSADALLDQAQESYATWPSPRTLRFCDVVHFIVVSEFLASHSDTPWIQTDMRRKVESLIPHNL
jgi:hypothetical protein